MQAKLNMSFLGANVADYAEVVVIDPVIRISAKAQSLVQIAPLLSFDIRLQIRTSDIVVRIGEQIDVSLLDWRHANRAALDESLIEFDGAESRPCRSALPFPGWFAVSTTESSTER
jgi:hypothetical protein